MGNSIFVTNTWAVGTFDPVTNGLGKGLDSTSALSLFSLPGQPTSMAESRQAQRMSSIRILGTNSSREVLVHFNKVVSNYTTKLCHYKSFRK
jgi:hypothetical protein